MMKRTAILVALSAIAGCANQQYAGINYGEVTMPNGENWKIAGGKEETNVSFKVTPSAAGNLLVHVGAARGDHSYPCTTTNTTKILDGVTGGGNDFVDFAFCVGTATAVDTSSVTGTMDWSASDRVQSIMVVIK